MATSPAVPALVRRRGDALPDRLYVLVPGLDRRQAYRLASDAVTQARLIAPKMSGHAARGISTYYGDGFFGLRWSDPYLWYQESGTRPRTMRNLAGKVIPMWIDDPTGTEARKNPRARTRFTANGRRQILIFRKAARIGATKVVRRRTAGGMTEQTVPASYPGAPGRITHRQHVNLPGNATAATGRIATTIARPHVGVRWRNPGLLPRRFMSFSLQQVAVNAGLGPAQVHSAYRRR